MGDRFERIEILTGRPISVLVVIQGDEPLDVLEAPIVLCAAELCCARLALTPEEQEYRRQMIEMPSP